MSRNIAFWWRLFAPSVPPALAQARPRSQKYSQNSGSTDKPGLAHNTHASKARYVTAVPAIVMLAVAEHHTQTNRMGVQCVVRCRYEPTAVGG